ncbi:efflux RND transporter periplasmic adaptor subunit [Paenibacillus flagellatus]|uniref:Efflux RND transporter periplasmic adaptor subunit n=1 Tax=Paenibacillus flagellatus TaxID=2211139 RepID=A0A2V5KEA3_9BACL|nr:efflux RND transporter periplasmic adaptor subunit [Paenibacillus flagellatus]PYI56403.1 efflux RND transporter periplasmic adaptor subunit [Paenibacillus flagellatus]
MRKKKTWLYVAIAVVLFAVSSVLYLQSHPGAPAPNKSSAAGNSAIKFKAVKENLANTVEVKGKSSYIKETIVYAPFSADVTAWSVNDGAQVKQGDPLFVLDGKELRDQIAAQSANVRKLELEAKLKAAEQASQVKSGETIAASESEALQRFAQTASRDVQSELDRLNRSVAATELEAKREKLAKAEATAPENGIFLFAGTPKPQKVKEGDAVGKIVDVSKLQMTASVGEYDVFRIRPGMPVQVTIDALKQTKLTGVVEKVSKFPKAAANETSAAQFEVVISIDAHESLIAGLGLTASIETDNKKDVLTVPTIAVQRDKEGYYVMLETAQGVEKRPIRVGLETADKTEVLEGLQEGDTIVLQ